MRALLIIAIAVSSIAGAVYAAPPASKNAPSKQELARATALVDQAVALFRAERYLGAAELFLEAHDASRLPVQLRNAAKAFELGGDEARALEAWRRYAEDPALNAAERGEANAEIARIEEKQTARDAIRAAEKEAARAKEEAARARAVTATSTETPAREHTATRDPPAATLTTSNEVAAQEDSASGPLYLAGGSALAAIAGAILYAHASSRLSALDEALATTDGAGKINGIDRAVAADRLSSINTERNAAAFALSAGAAALTTAAVWWLIDRE